MTVQTPIPDFAAARAAMVENQLRPEGVTDPAVLDAMGTVARRSSFRPRRARSLMSTAPCRWAKAVFLPAPSVLGSTLTQMMLVAASARSSWALAPAIRPRSFKRWAFR